MKFPALFLLLTALAPLRAALDDSLKTLIAVGREGEGNEAASAAWREVVKAGPPAIPALLMAAGKGSEVSDNWLRLAGDVIVENAQRARAELPFREMESFLTNVLRPAAGRQLAFDLLTRADRTRAEAIEPFLIQDPVQTLRRGAVQRIIDGVKEKPDAAKRAAYLEALGAARDEDQATFLAGELKRLNVPVDLPRHFGFLLKWNVIGPFDNTDRKGFATEFPPEKEVKLDAAYEGRGGPVTWRPFESKDEYGKLDFNKPLGMLKEVTAYAATTFDAPIEREAELRLGCKNAWKVWLNGELLFARDEYHRGQEIDQYKLKCHLKAGPNAILVKCCQNEQKEDWTVEWEFQIRVCDSTGTALPSEK